MVADAVVMSDGQVGSTRTEKKVSLVHNPEERTRRWMRGW